MSFRRLQRCAIFLSEFDYDLEYIDGKRNLGADGLSRFPVLDKYGSDTDEEECEYIKFIEINKVTNETPSKLMLGRNIKNRLGFVRLFQSAVKSEAGKREESFKEEQVVCVKDYRTSKKILWIKGNVIQVLGERTYLIKCDGNTERKRHLDQIVSGVKLNDIVVPNEIVAENTVKKNNDKVDFNKESLSVGVSCRPEKIVKKTDF
ncbi:Hypothetical protein CINCED_3A019826 [Cinara cedri]|uniref:Uncharacterized protein n=1 Tax=Cinara cedri TaxID=506608 RepID=A0A5E4N4X1_9HEMI|nr:Hypothetical protein CINCED_3A019826 [Cinara cedri]